MSPALQWRIGPDRVLDLRTPCLMGILNVTPDSFSDGGEFQDLRKAADHAIDMASSGADIIDIGGESTRPGADRISVQEQIERVVPVIEAVSAQSSIPISIDTTRAAVAEAALDAGACIINDVAAGNEDAELIPLAASRGCGLVLMHRQRPPEEDSWSTDTVAESQDSIMDEVHAWLHDRAGVAIAQGVSAESICLDPGLGFGKSVAENWELMVRSRDFVQMGYPILGAASRKSFLGAVTGIEDPALRLEGSLAASAIHLASGVQVLRVHDVPAHAKLISLWR